MTTIKSILDPQGNELFMRTLSNAAQLIDGIKLEWLPQKCWSEWDQSVRDDISKCLTELQSGINPDSPPAK